MPSASPPSLNDVEPVVQASSGDSAESSPGIVGRLPEHLLEDAERIRIENQRKGSVVMIEPRRRTPTETVIDFEGNMHTVRTHKVTQASRCSRQFLTFVVHTTVLVALAVFSIVMMVLEGFGTAAFSFYASLFTLAIGGFLPNPKLKKDGPGLESLGAQQAGVAAAAGVAPAH